MTAPNPFPLSSMRLIVTNGGQSYDTNIPGPYGFKVLGYDGLGLMSIRRLSQKAPRQRGVTDLGYSQEARYFGLTLEFRGYNLTHYGSLREQALAMFAPHEYDNITCTFYAFGKARAVDCNLDGDLDFLSSERQYTRQVVTVSLKADDPRLYHPTRQEVNFSPLTGNDGWEIPWMIPWFIAEGNANNSTTVTYAEGSFAAAPEYPLLRLYGPITDPIITNETTDERISLPGLSFGAGQFVTIDLAGGPFRDASPRIRDENDASVEQYLDNANSNLSTWHFAPAGELLTSGFRSTGDNVIRVQGTGASSLTRLQMLYYNRYIGI